MMNVAFIVIESVIEYLCRGRGTNATSNPDGASASAYNDSSIRYNLRGSTIVTELEFLIPH